MKKIMLLVCSLFLAETFAGDTTNAIYREYKDESHELDSAVKQSYNNYFKHDSLAKVWNKRSDTIPEALAAIIQQSDIKDSIQREETRGTLLRKYKIREAVALMARLDSLRSKGFNLASAY